MAVTTVSPHTVPWTGTAWLDAEVAAYLTACTAEITGGPITAAGTDRCGSCGSVLYTNGTCPNCDRAPRGDR